jgi:cysteine synthase A
MTDRNLGSLPPHEEEQKTGDNLPLLGQTRLIRLKSFPRVLLKCEHENPTGSHKDRAYSAMLIAENIPLTGKTIVDYTTGNGGISLAWLAQHIGARAVVFMPEGLGAARSRMIRSYGAELILTSKEGFVASARMAAENYAKEHPEAVLLSQSDNFANQYAFHKVGEEILNQLGRQQVRPAAFTCAIGTGGTFSGIVGALKGEFRRIRAIGIEVPEAPVIWAKRHGKTVELSLPSIIGMGAGKIALNTDERLIDDVEVVGAKDILDVTSRLLITDGLDIGPSTAANVLIAAKLADNFHDDVLTVSFDRGDRYESEGGDSSATN